MNILMAIAAIFSILFLAGCPGKVDPGNNVDTKLGDMGPNAGLPLIHVFTAGFNGVPSEVNDTGPAPGVKGK